MYVISQESRSDSRLAVKVLIHVGTATLGCPGGFCRGSPAHEYNPAPAIIATSGATMRTLLLALSLAFATNLAAAQQYDLVIEGGRVIDPETHLDAVRNVGIRDGKIAASPPPRSADAASSTPPASSSLPASSTCTSTHRTSPASASKRSTA